MNTTQSQPEYEIVIRPNQGWFNIDWKGLRDYRDLLFLLVRRDFVARYQQTVLGPLWFIINPMVSAIMNMLVLNGIIGMETAPTPPLLFFLSGQIIWGYFSSLLDSTGATFTNNAHLFGKVYFPRLIVPLAQALSNLLNLGVQLLSFAALYIFYRFQTLNSDPSKPALHFGLDPHLLPLLPVFILHMAVLGLGAGMIIAALTAKYRDFRYLTGFLQQIWMMASAVMYPLSTLLDKAAKHGVGWLVSLNPMLTIVEGSRVALLGNGTFQSTYYLISVGVSVVIFGIGLMMFQRSSRTFVDII